MMKKSRTHVTLVTGMLITVTCLFSACSTVCDRTTAAESYLQCGDALDEHPAVR